MRVKSQSEMRKKGCVSQKLVMCIVASLGKNQETCLLFSSVFENMRKNLSNMTLRFSQ